MLLAAVLLVMVAGQPSCEPLSAIYNAMGGPGWKNKASQAGGRSWIDPAIPCCSKEFVTCDGKQRAIRKIAWNSIKGLKGTIPPQLGLLTLLEEIDVERTAVSGTLADALFSVDSKIEKLKIKRTYITGTLPPSLFLSGTLEKVSAKKAGLSGTIPPAIGMATKLEELDLHESQNCGQGTKRWKRENCKGFSGTLPPEIGLATKLEEINTEKNIISGTLPASLALLRKLKTLKVADSLHSGTIPRGLHVSRDCDLVDADPPPAPHPPGKAPEPPAFGRMLAEALLGGSAPLDAASEEQPGGVRRRLQGVQLAHPPPHAGWAPAPPLSNWGVRGEAGGFPGLLPKWGGWNKGPEGENPHDPWDRGRLYDGRPKVLWAHWVSI